LLSFSISQTIEKHEPKAKILLEKLSTAWDSYGLAVHQLKLLDEERVDDADGLKEKTQAYEDGEEMLRDFVGWVEKVYTPDEDADAEVEKVCLFARMPCSTSKLKRRFGTLDACR